MKKFLKTYLFTITILTISYFLGGLVSPATIGEEDPIIIKMILGMLSLLILWLAYIMGSLIVELLET